MAAESSAEEILQGLARHINCLGDENRNVRKRALEGIKKETFGRKPELSPDTLQSVLNTILRQVMKTVSDPVEKCRELSVDLVLKYVSTVLKPADILPYLVPVLVQRLGQQEIIESSEELRLNMAELLSKIVAVSKNNIVVFLDDMVRMLQRLIVDPYPEVKKESCRCASALAKSVPQAFQTQSENLIKPLLHAVSHQHSRVRVEVINAIRDVIQYGHNKNVDDVVSHLAQRCFDQAPAVRKAVVNLAGTWLLDLPDRYSFFHKLIPLLLSGLTDEVTEINEQADALWHDVGIKYGRENEDDLKDKEDFAKPDPVHYPLNVERPNLGCRYLMFRNVSKILPGLVKDLGDWVAATRIKSSALLYYLLLNNEEYTTQHLQLVLSGMYKACHDEEKEVVTQVVKSAELLGYFIDPEVWCSLVLSNIKTTQSFGSLMVLSAIIKGSERFQLKPHLGDICNTLALEGVCTSVEVRVQEQLLACVESIVTVAKEDCKDTSLQLFTVLITVLALLKDEDVQHKVHQLLDLLSESQRLLDRQHLFNIHTKQVLDGFQHSYVHWTNYSVERLVFDSLLLESGPVVGELLEDVIPVLVTNLDPEKDAELRLKFFSLLSKLVMNAPSTLNSQQRFGDFAVTVVRDMVIPNCVWKAGRTAGAIRTTAVSCLWALLQSGVLIPDKLSEVSEDLLTQLISLLTDDNKSTRLVTCRVITKVFNLMGPTLDQHRLHNLYPDLLKRLDDSSDDIRVAVAHTFVAYFKSFAKGFDADMYRAHIEEIYKGLLVHLDDPSQRIQEAVLDVLTNAASIKPDMLAKEIDSVKHKHRSVKYCDQLLEHIQKITSTS